jgi:hypothetical protein
MRADGEVRDHVGGSVQKLTPVFSPCVPFLCIGFRLAARAMGGAIPMGAADGRSPNPDHGRCRCRWRAARRKDMRLRTGGWVEAHASGRENRDMRESRDHVRSTCRARGAGGRHTTHAHGRAFDPGARSRSRIGERRVPLLSLLAVPVDSVEARPRSRALW